MIDANCGFDQPGWAAKSALLPIATKCCFAHALSCSALPGSRCSRCWLPRSCRLRRNWCARARPLPHCPITAWNRLAPHRRIHTIQRRTPGWTRADSAHCTLIIPSTCRRLGPRFPSTLPSARQVATSITSRHSARLPGAALLRAARPGVRDSTNRRLSSHTNTRLQGVRSMRAVAYASMALLVRCRSQRCSFLTDSPQRPTGAAARQAETRKTTT